MTDAALLEQIRAVLAASPFYGEGHRKGIVKLMACRPGTGERAAADLFSGHHSGASLL
jgi:hypothetical protein